MQGLPYVIASKTRSTACALKFTGKRGDIRKGHDKRRFTVSDLPNQTQ